MPTPVDPGDRTGRPLRPRGRPGPLVLAGLFFSVAAPVPADIIRLRNGREIQGEVLHEGKEEVVISFPGGTLRLKRRQIEAIQRQSRSVYLLEEGEKALRRKDYRTAIEALEKARREEPGSEKVRLGLWRARHDYASHLGDGHRYQQALGIYRQLLDEDPGNREALEEIRAIEDAQRQAIDELRLARREVREGDLETSLWRLETSYETFPDLRQSVAKDLATAHARRGHDLAGRSRWGEAARQFQSALTVDPEHIGAVRVPFVTCMLGQITPLARAGKFESIEPLARQGLEVDPSSERLTYFLALSLNARGEFREAARLYASILGERVASVSQRAVSELRERVEAEVKALKIGEIFYETRAASVLPGKFRTIKTPHFVVKHRNHEIGRAVSRAAERFYQDLFRRLGCQTHWDSCEIVIYPTRERYLRHEGTGAWSGAMHELTQRRRMFSKHRIVSYQKQGGLTSNLLKHEIAHALLSHRLSYPTQLPLWANEGFAVSEEPVFVHRHYRRILARERAQGHLIPLSRLLESRTYPDAREINLFYAQSFGVVDYLLARRGTATFLRFLRDVSSATRPLEAALRKYYGFRSITALENRWRGSL